MNFLKNLICGDCIGIAEAIPGVSGGTVAVLLKIYDDLIGSISKLKQQFKKSILYLIPIALHRAAVLAEDLKQPSEALTYYRSIEKNYAKSYFNMDRVYYNIARLEETLGNTDAAKTAYRLLIETAGNKEVDSSLVSVAKDRLIYLESADLDNQEEAPNEETVAAE